MAKKLMFIHPEGNLNNNPNLTAIVEILCESGYEIDYYARKNTGMRQETPCSGARFLAVDTSSQTLPDYSVILHDVVPDPVAYYRSLLEGRIPRYDLVIGVDRGVIEAQVIAAIQGIPYGLISYEIWFAHETNASFKAPEIAACRNLSFAVCQDAVRSSLLARENQIPLFRMINIPVAGRGPRAAQRSKILHESLKLPQDARIALYMGEISAAWSNAELLVDAMPAAQNWCLVLHHRYGAGNVVHNPALKRVVEGRAKNVFLSPLPPLPIDQMHHLLGAADVGIAFYTPVNHDSTAGDNLRYLGMASGKLSTYLQHGLPVIVNEIGEFSTHVREYNLGEVVTESGDTLRALEKIAAADCCLLQRNCLEFFEERLDANRTTAPLMRTIDRLSNPQRFR